jgi:hypothetical protein
LTISDILRAGLDGYIGLVLEAGGKVVNSKRAFSDDEVLEDILAVWQRVGKKPSTRQYEAFGKFSSRSVKRRFESWIRACAEAESRSTGAHPAIGSNPPGVARRSVVRAKREASVSTEVSSYLGELDRFRAESRLGVEMMAAHYAKLYCLERQMRTTIADTLQDAVGDSWWATCVSQDIRDNATKNVKAEERLGVTPRSERLIDYTTLGELGQIVDSNWKVFATVFKNQEAMKRVMRDLNMLRAFVAHCTPLPADEVTRLELNISDWIRQLR